MTKPISYKGQRKCKRLNEFIKEEDDTNEPNRDGKHDEKRV